jgi:hypothetical protein
MPALRDFWTSLRARLGAVDLWTTNLDKWSTGSTTPMGQTTTVPPGERGEVGEEIIGTG